MPEILLILALALIIIGPKKLPELAKTLGKSLGEFKNAAQDFKDSINIESSIADMDPPAEEIQKNVKEANKELAEEEDKDKPSLDADFNTEDEADIPDDKPDDPDDPDDPDENPDKSPDMTQDSTPEKDDLKKDDLKEDTQEK